MKTILSIQSHVAYGYVGNRAAVFPLQCMGFDVSAVHTVQFSNHTGYGSWTGEVFSPEHIRALIGGLRDRGVLHRFDAVLSGYLGDASLGEAVLDAVSEIRAANPGCIYCCDPVMGDVGRGLFVRPNIPDFFRDRAAPQAGILTPNVFELELLSGRTIASLADARDACASLHDRGIAKVLVTSLQEVAGRGTISMMASTAGDGAFSVTTPYIPFDPMPNGSGDLTAALFLGHVVAGRTADEALARTATAVFRVFEETGMRGGRELALIAAQDAYRADAPVRFSADPL